MNSRNIFTLAYLLIVCYSKTVLHFLRCSHKMERDANSLLEQRKYHMNHVHLNRKPASRRLFQKSEIESATLFMLLYIGLDAGENNCSNHRYV